MHRNGFIRCCDCGLSIGKFAVGSSVDEGSTHVCPQCSEARRLCYMGQKVEILKVTWAKPEPRQVN